MKSGVTEFQKDVKKKYVKETIRMNSEESKIIDQTVEETASVSLAVEESKE